MKIHKIALFVALSLASIHAYACKIPKSYYKHVSCTARADTFLAVKDDGSPVALLNTQGEKVADLFAYDAVLPQEFKGGLLPVKKGNKVGYINQKGKVVIGLDYEPLSGGVWAKGVQNGRIIVKRGGGYGVIDVAGKVIIKPSKNNHPNDLTQGNLLGGQTPNNRTTKNNTAKPTPPSPKKPEVVKAITPPKPTQTKTTPKTIDKTPTVVAIMTPPQTATPKPNRPAKPQAITLSTNPPTLLTPEWIDDKWQYVNAQGKVIPVLQFDAMMPYSEQMSAVRMGDRWGFIDPQGQIVIDFRFHKDGFILNSQDAPHLTRPLTFMKGIAWVGNLRDGTKLCIDRTGENVPCS